MKLNFDTYLSKLKTIDTSDALFQEIISFGRTSPYKNSWDFSDKDRVSGCQSLLFVRLYQKDGMLYFEFYSDALISQGLAALLIHFYSGKTLEQFIKSPPTFLKDLKLGHLLSAGRSNGVNSLYKKMLELALASYKSP